MKKEDLLKLIEDDDLGLLDIKPKSSSTSPDDRLLSSFQEIVDFIKSNNREPQQGKGIVEHQLASRLGSIRQDKSKIEKLLIYDELDLLSGEVKEISSLKDIVLDDDLGILNSQEQEIFDIKNVPEIKDRESAEFIARRKPCKDFDKYKDLFAKCQEELGNGKRKLRKFDSDHLIEQNRFFVLNGILLYIVEIYDTFTDKNGKLDGRQRCIFENGTESNMLIRSLGKGLYENGYAVTENEESDRQDIINNFNLVNDGDQKTGFIYILKSLSTDEKIRNIENLFKIGYSTTSVEDRIKNAELDPTYLMSPVQIITTFECYNLNPQKLEQLLHNFFGTACLNIDIYDSTGKRHMPREWFIAPLKIIEEAVELVINGGITNFKYDQELELIVLR